ncbi:hypothetical protein [Lactococcus lactis]|uniref:hypothetical protein n=1 Tax=Lactococcus lactis TaxID=1358 RepID=UPI00288C9500|nr:hypothetical protein [Lactococcus lactis]MDT2887941.1 hypothetical protein [Lactococcus lactis]MDT2930721.1 hypothetical protein [Lactococcus lactis]
MKQKQIKAIKKQIVEESAINVGYYESVIPEIIENIDPDTFYHLMGRSSGEWLLEAAKSNNRAEFQNILVSEAVKTMSYSEFKTIAHYFFSYQQTSEEIIAKPLEVTTHLFNQLQNESDEIFGSNNKADVEQTNEEKSNVVHSSLKIQFLNNQDFLSRIQQDPTYMDHQYPELSKMISQSGMRIVNYSQLSDSQQTYIKEALYFNNEIPDPLVVQWDDLNDHSIYSSLEMALIEWYTDQDFSSGFVEDIPEGGTIYDLDSKTYNIKGIESLLKFDYFSGESTSLTTLKELGVSLPPASLIGSLPLQDRIYDEKTHLPYDWNDNTISEALEGYDYSIMTGTEYYDLLEEKTIEINGTIFHEQDFSNNQIVVYDLKDPEEIFYFGESAIDAIDALEDLPPFQEKMQDWDRKWDNNQWLNIIEKFAGETQTMTKAFNFEETQNRITEDISKAEDDFKQRILEKSPTEIFDNASKIIYVSDALFELAGFVEDFTLNDYQERSYSYEKQLSALFDRYDFNPPINGSETFIAAAERAWFKSEGNYEIGSDDKSYFMEDYVAGYFELSPYLKAYEPKPVEISNDDPQHSQSKSHSI